MSGPWGAPAQTIKKAIERLDAAGVRVCRLSPVYTTLPVGMGMQGSYINMVVCASTNISANSLLILIKKLQNDAGRGIGRHWSSRTLDLDLVDYGGRVLGWPPPELRRSKRLEGRRAPNRLVLPHPQAHRRHFVLQPLSDVSPHWRHPALALPVGVLIKRLKGPCGIISDEHLDVLCAQALG